MVRQMGLHQGTHFVDLNLTEAVDRGAVFTECTFRRAQFNCSVHTDARAALVIAAALGLDIQDDA